MQLLVRLTQAYYRCLSVSVLQLQILTCRSNCIRSYDGAVSLGDQPSSQAGICSRDPPILCLFEICLHYIHYSYVTIALGTGRKPWQCGADETFRVCSHDILCVLKARTSSVLSGINTIKILGFSHILTPEITLDACLECTQYIV